MAAEQDDRLEVASKPHLRFNACVVPRIEMYCSSASGGLRFQSGERLDLEPNLRF
jgi:hypothetical protein